MSPLQALAIFAAGLGAGTVNVVVGSGSLITFPTLLAFGYPPVVANVTNTVGLVPGSTSGVVAYRAELVGQRARAVTLGAAAGLGGITGGVLLLALPSSVFERVVPILILVAAGLMAVQPAVSRRLAGRGERPAHGGPGLVACVFATGIYGGYFGAAQGVILIALLAIFLDDDLQRLNATKNVLALVANLVAAVLFIAVTHVAWGVAGVLAAGSVVGGQLGGTLGRRLRPQVYRLAVVVIGVGVAITLFITGT